MAARQEAAGFACVAMRPRTAIRPGSSAPEAEARRRRTEGAALTGARADLRCRAFGTSRAHGRSLTGHRPRGLAKITEAAWAFAHGRRFLVFGLGIAIR